MRTIHKYPVALRDLQTINMPLGALPLCVQVQQDQPMLWALVDTEQPEMAHHFALRGTGHLCDPIKAENYVGTFQLYDGALVFHLFGA